jgi:hypothetical protein
LLDVVSAYAALEEIVSTGREAFGASKEPQIP